MLLIHAYADPCTESNKRKPLDDLHTNSVEQSGLSFVQ
jgi:hypothetical protein